MNSLSLNPWKWSRVIKLTMAKLTCKFFANIENAVSLIVSIKQDAAGNSRDSAKSCSFYSISREKFHCSTLIRLL